MARRQVSTDLGSARFRPAASPVDTFAPSSAGSGLQQLASSLSAVAPALQRYAIQKQDQLDEQSMIRAEQQFQKDAELLRESAETFRDARAKGLIETHQDPIYRARYQELMGRHLGEVALSGWQLVRQSQLSEGTTLEEFDQLATDYFNGFEKEQLGANDEPALATAFRATTESGILDDRRTYSAEAGRRLLSKADEGYFAEISAGAFNHLTQGASAEDLGAWLQTRLDAHIDLQDPGTGGARLAAVRRKANLDTLRAGAAAAVQAALLGPDPRAGLTILAAFRNVQTAPGHTLADSSQEAAGIMLAANGEIMQAIARADGLAQRERDAEVDGIVSDAMRTMSEAFSRGEHPSPQMLSAAIAQLSLSSHPQAATRAQSLLNLQQSMEAAVEQSDPETFETLSKYIYNTPGSVEDHHMFLNAALEAQSLSTNDFMRLWALADNLASAREGQGPLNDPVYKALERNFLAVMGEGDLIPNGQNKLNREQAHPLFIRAYLDFRAVNPNATPKEIQDYMLDVSAGLQQNFPPQFDLRFSITPKAKWFTHTLYTAPELALLGRFVQSGEIPRGDELATLQDLLFRAGVDLDDVNSGADLALLLAAQQERLSNTDR